MKKTNIYLSEIETFKAKFSNLPEFQNRSRAKKETGISYLGDVNHSAKSEHGTKYNIFTYIVYLAPADLSGCLNTCPGASPECREACLNRAGRAKIEAFAGLNTIERARILRTWLYVFNRAYFMAWIAAELAANKAKYSQPGQIFAARLNGTSDIKWENVEYQQFSNIFAAFPDVRFYDYTKIPGRKIENIVNYSLTFSYTGRNTLNSLQVLENQGNVAIVFNVKPGQPLPAYWRGYKVLDGDVTDYRPADCKGCVVGLRFKLTDSQEVNRSAIDSPFIVDPQSLDCQYVTAGPEFEFNAA